MLGVMCVNCLLLVVSLIQPMLFCLCSFPLHMLHITAYAHSELTATSSTTACILALRPSPEQMIHHPCPPHGTTHATGMCVEHSTFLFSCLGLPPNCAIVVDHLPAIHDQLHPPTIHIIMVSIPPPGPPILLPYFVPAQVSWGHTRGHHCGGGCTHKHCHNYFVSCDMAFLCHRCSQTHSCS